MLNFSKLLDDFMSSVEKLVERIAKLFIDVVKSITKERVRIEPVDKTTSLDVSISWIGQKEVKT